MQENKFFTTLIKYIFLFTIFVIIIIFISSFFYKIVNKMNTELDIDSQYRKLGLYLLDISQKSVTISKYGLTNENDSSSYFITFSDYNGNQNTFIKVGDKIYFNNIELCDNVKLFKIIIDKSEKEYISIDVVIGNKEFTSQYVL